MYYSDRSNSYWYTKAQWSRRWVYWPRRCAISGAILWMEWAHCGVMMHTGPAVPEFEVIWHRDDEHLIWLLKY